MKKDFSKDIEEIMNMMEVLIYAERWIESGGECSFSAQGAIIAHSEYLLNKLRILSVNYIGQQ